MVALAVFWTSIRQQAAGGSRRSPIPEIDDPASRRVDDPETVRLCTDIVASQQREIGQMKRDCANWRMICVAAPSYSDGVEPGSRMNVSIALPEY
ncbi:MAG: hypothetical protein ACREV5_01920 [Steroidobacter sp.]